MTTKKSSKEQEESLGKVQKALTKGTLENAKMYLTMTQKVSEIEEDMFNIGKVWVAKFEENPSMTATRGANMAFRCSALAMRDHKRYHVEKV